MNKMNKMNETNKQKVASSSLRCATSNAYIPNLQYVCCCQGLAKRLSLVPIATFARPTLGRHLLPDVPDDLDDDLGGRARVGHATPPVDVQVEAVALDERLSADLSRRECPRESSRVESSIVRRTVVSGGRVETDKTCCGGNGGLVMYIVSGKHLSVDGDRHWRSLEGGDRLAVCET